MTRRNRLYSWLAWLTLVLAGPAAPVLAGLSYQPLAIPTRDGKQLAADAYFDGTLAAPKPVVLIQTPYNKNRYRHQAQLPPEAGGIGFPVDPHYYYVVVDWRGFYGSAAAAVPGYDRGLDGYDCVEWIAAQPWSDGRVGTWGHSALGYIQFLTARHRPPHLLCCAPFAKDYLMTYSDYYYGGDYRKEHVESLEKLGLANAETILAHPDEDALWLAAQAQSELAPEVAVPMLLAVGWYDHYPGDVIAAFEALRRRSDPAVRAAHRIFIGPWVHGGMNEARQGELDYPDAVGIHDELTVQFWDHYLRGLDNGWAEGPVVRYYQLGESAWCTAADWAGIAREERRLYLGPGGGLGEAPAPGPAGPDSFLYDPADPTPALGGSRFNPFDPSVATGPVDIHAAIETRPDVLVYSTPVLTEKLRINGPLEARLWVSSDRPDTDFAVRLTDVYPDGRSMIITQGIRRMRFRLSYATETLMTPGQIYPVTVPLQDLALTIPPGHRLRLVVSSADYPHYDRNRNDGGPLYGADGPLLVAANALHRDADHPSQLVFHVPDRCDIDGDGAVDAADLALLAGALADNLALLPDAGSGGDIDRDGRVASPDLVALQFRLVGTR